MLKTYLYTIHNIFILMPWTRKLHKNIVLKIIVFRNMTPGILSNNTVRKKLILFKKHTIEHVLLKMV